MKSNSVTRQTLNDWRAVTCSDRRSIKTLAEEVEGCRGGEAEETRVESEQRTETCFHARFVFLSSAFCKHEMFTLCSTMQTTQDSQHVCSVFSLSSGAAPWRVLKFWSIQEEHIQPAVSLKETEVKILYHQLHVLNSQQRWETRGMSHSSAASSSRQKTLSHSHCCC